jgi:hypothetical protein
MRLTHIGQQAIRAKCSHRNETRIDAMTKSFAPNTRLRLLRSDPFDLASVLLIVALAALALATLHEYAISNDEEVQHRYGELIVAYYTSGFADRTLFNFSNLYLYGGLFDVVAILVGNILPADIFVIRHMLCALTGVGGIAAAWATARMIGGPRAGLFAALALALCGPWYGTMFNHTKDVPFAAAMIGACFFLLRVTRALPRPQLRDLILFGVLTGVALGQRAMGFLLPAYVLIAIALHAPRPFSLNLAARSMGPALVLFVPAFALAYLIMIAAWPWAALGLFNPIRAIFAFAHFQYPIKTLLAGNVYLMDQTPRGYVPVYLAIKLPLIVLLGAALALVTLGVKQGVATAHGDWRARATAFITITIALPLLAQVTFRGPAFTGMRHFTYVVPPIAVMAGIGFDYVLTWLAERRRMLANAALAGIGIWFLWTAGVLVRLHPYEYLYFNEIVGGLAGAAQRYDTDYWVSVMHEAVAELERVLDHEDAGPGPYFVAVCGERMAFEYEAAPRGRLKWATDTDPADFFIAPTHMRCDRAIDGNVIVKIARMGVTIGVVKDRRATTRTRAAVQR